MCVHGSSTRHIYTGNITVAFLDEREIYKHELSRAPFDSFTSSNRQGKMRAYIYVSNKLKETSHIAGVGARTTIEECAVHQGVCRDQVL